MYILGFTGLCLWTAVFSAGGAIDPYPVGDAFPLGLYSIDNPEEMKQLTEDGWNLAHTYGFTPEFLATCAEGGMRALAHLPGSTEPVPESETEELIASLAQSPTIAWWDLPEERRWWREGEMQLVTELCQWTRTYDPHKRPNYMYLPGHYTAEDVAKYVPHLDIVPASVYTTYALMPHAWVRWRMEETIQGIRDAGATIGKDYLNGEKTPIAVLELFYEATEKDQAPKVMTPEGAYHDFWQCIVSGARGVLLFSYYHKRDRPEFEENWRAYCRAASQITGPERLGEVILAGVPFDGVSCEIIDGPAQTGTFVPHGTTLDPVSFPSVDLLAKQWQGSLYVVLVNSAESPVTARIQGLPPAASEAQVLFEGQTIPLEAGGLDISFPPLGVKILKMATDV